MAATALFGGVIAVLAGMTPAELVAYTINNPPAWMMSGWTRLILVLVGLPIIYASISFNRWSQRQVAVDDLAEEISSAIHELFNRHTRLTSAQISVAAFPSQLDRDFKEWCTKVSNKLGNRAFFTRADQLHFDRIGAVKPMIISGNPDADHTLAMLSIKFDRLRDIIKWVQQRPR